MLFVCCKSCNFIDNMELRIFLSEVSLHFEGVGNYFELSNIPGSGSGRGHAQELRTEFTTCAELLKFKQNRSLEAKHGVCKISSEREIAEKIIYDSLLEKARPLKIELRYLQQQHTLAKKFIARKFYACLHDGKIAAQSIEITSFLKKTRACIQPHSSTVITIPCSESSHTASCSQTV